MSKQGKARIMLLISVTIFGTLGLFTRNITVSSSELALYRAVMATILIVGYLVITKTPMNLKGHGKDMVPLVCSGIAMGINWILLFEAYKYTTISSATISYYFAPTIVTVACCFFFREALTKKKMICFLMSTVGLVLTIGIDNMIGGSEDAKGILFGLAAACFYAMVILLNKSIQTIAGLQRTILQFVAAIVVLVPYVACTSGVTLGTLNTKGWLSLLVVGIVHTGIAYCLYFAAIKDLLGQESAILSYVDPLVAVCMSVFLLGEHITAMQVIGAILIFGFTLWNELSLDGLKEHFARRKSNR